MSSLPGRWPANAATLWERLDAVSLCSCQPRCGLGAAQGELAAVVRALGGAERARHWLARAGVQEQGIAAIVMPRGEDAAPCLTRYVAGLPWAVLAQEAVTALESLVPVVIEPPPGTTLPLFPEISAQLARSVARHLTPPGRLDFAAPFARSRVRLWHELGRLTQHLLAADFQAFRAEISPTLIRARTSSRKPSSDDDAAVYRRWLEEIRDGRARAMASEYPVLFRLVGEVSAAWTAVTAELFDRLERDWADLATTFRFDTTASLEDVDFGLSDPHDGGRQVARLRVADRIVYYKPRPLDGEHLWLNLIGVLAASDGPNPYHPGMTASPMLLRDGYGYVAGATAGGIERHQVEEYHRELGAVLALFYAMNGTDGHMQNLVVSNGHPVIVDLETLLDAPTAATELPGSGLSVATQGWAHQQRHSVASTGLLPLWVEWEDRVVDHSAIGAHAADNDVHVARRIVVDNPGSVNLRIREDAATGGSAPSIPWCDGEEVAATDHVDAVAEGFHDGYLLVQRESGTLEQVVATGVSSVRQVLRPTRRYAAVAAWLLAPRWLTSGVARSAGALQALHQQWMHRSEVWPRVVVAESRALDRQDIPLFTTRVDEMVLRDGRGPVGPWFAATPLEAIHTTLAGLSEADRAVQIRMIRLSFAARAAGRAVHHGEASAPVRVAAAAQREGSGAGGTDHVDAVVERLIQDAIDMGGSSDWLTLANDPRTERFEYRLADHGVFGGSAGTALFLAAAARTGASRATSTRDTAASALALRALTHSAVHLAGAEDLTPGDHALSLLRTAYVAAFLSRCGFRDPALISRIKAAVGSIEPSVLGQDRHLDVLFGCASGLLASTRAGEVFGWPRLLDCAEACAENLLANQQAQGADAGGWRTEASPDRSMTGFSHGASGIVYALVSAGARDDARVARAVERGLLFESHCFDERLQTWRRSPDADSHGVSWCHGAPGIGLARAGMIRARWDNPDVRDDLSRALDAARRHVTPTDTFCCGAAGVSELFLTAAEVLRSPALAEEGRSVLARTILRRKPVGYELGTSTNAVCHPGLYQGMPGIAYVLLRSRSPSLPGFALWDLPATPGPDL